MTSRSEREGCHRIEVLPLEEAFYRMMNRINLKKHECHQFGIKGIPPSADKGDKGRLFGLILALDM